MAPSAFAESAIQAQVRCPGLWIMVALLCAAHTVAGLDALVVVLLVPGMKASLQLNDTQVSLLNGAAFAICHAAAVLVCGRLADRTNRRNLLILGVAGWSLATLAGGFAQTFAALAAARIAVGIFQGVLIPTTLSMLVDAAPPEVRGRAITTMMCGGALGGAASNFVGGGLLQLFTSHPQAIPFGLSLAPWQAVLVCCGLPGLVLTPLLLTLREPARQTAASGSAFRLLPWMRTHAAAFLPLFAACLCFLMAGYAQASWGAVILLRNLHMTPASVGLALGVISLIGAGVAATLGGTLSDAFVRRDPNAGRVRLLVLLLPVTAISSALYLAVGHPPVVIAGFAVTAIGATMTAALAATILPELTPSEGRGQIMAIFGLVGMLGGMGLAPTLVALVTDQVLHDEGRLPLSLVLVATPALLLACGLAALALPSARRLRKQVRAMTGEA